MHIHMHMHMLMQFLRICICICTCTCICICICIGLSGCRAVGLSDPHISRTKAHRSGQTLNLQTLAFAACCLLLACLLGFIVQKPTFGGQSSKNLNKMLLFFDCFLDQFLGAIWCQHGSNLAPKTNPKRSQVGFQDPSETQTTEMCKMCTSPKRELNF